MAVMSIKRGTQAFSAAQQSSGMKSSDAQRGDKAEFEKAFGQQDLGTVLNRVADANWVDPSKKLRTAGNNALDKDAFLKLMLAQMKHQDPTNPMQSHEMAAQLAQFTSLEQLNNINSTLESMKNAQSPNTNFQALALIGKKVGGDSSKLTRMAGDSEHSIRFELLNDAAKISLHIKDADGNDVRELTLADLKKGSHAIDWNGLLEDGQAARAGEYRVVVEAKNSAGAKVATSTAFEGRITGLNYTPQGPMLLVGKQAIKLSDIKKIEDPNLDNNGGQTKANDMSKTLGAALKASNFPVAPDESAKGNVQDVPMSRELLNSLAKNEGSKN